MAAERVQCFICRKEQGKAVCGKVRGPSGAVEHLCSTCLEKMDPKILKSIRIA